MDQLHSVLQSQAQISKNPVFKVDSGKLQILENPFEFYLSLCVTFKQKGIQVSSQRVLLSSLYFGQGNLEKFLIDQLYKKLQTYPRFKLNILLDYNRGLRLQDNSSYELLKHLKSGFYDNPNIRIGFYRNPSIPRVLSQFKQLGEILGVHHIKFAVFDDTIILTGANLSEDYFTDRQDRYFVIKGEERIADYLDDLINQLTDLSFQVGRLGQLLSDQNYTNRSHNLNLDNYDHFKKTMQDHFKLLQYGHGDTKQIIPDEVQFEQDIKQNDSEIEKVFKDQSQITKQLKLMPSKDNIFNFINQLPEQFNIVKGSGGWNSEIQLVKNYVYIMPQFNIPVAEINEDVQFLKSILKVANQVKLASGYLNLPKWIIEDLKSCKDLDILCASPNVSSIKANGFLGDGIKNYIPLMYRWIEQQLQTQLPNAKISEYQRDLWTFHAKGLWLYKSNLPQLVGVGSSNYCKIQTAIRSFTRDTELQFYIYSQCQNFSSLLHDETYRLWNQSEIVTKEQFRLKPFKPTLRVKFLTSFLKRFLQ